MRNQKGFTLIELIIVIVVLGILAVTAAPQFIDFSSDARSSTVKGLKGAINGASQTVNARAAVEGELGETGSLESGITLAWGYPDATASGIQDSLQIDTDDWTIIIGAGTAAADQPGDGVVAFAPADFTITGYDFSDPSASTAGTRCVVTYAEPTAEGERPSVTVDETDC